MELRDLIVTPVVILLVYFFAYLVRPYCTDEITRRYFIPGLTVRIVGALALGFIYQFYYDGGDTYNFHTHGSRHVWEAFMDDPEKGMRLFFNDPEDQAGLYTYSKRIWFYRDPSSYVIIRIAALFDLITFSTYSATAVIFAAVSFSGMWLFFLTFYRQFPYLHRNLAIAALFVPSVFFWGSGLLKDTITLACLGMATYCIYKLAVRLSYNFGWLILLLGSLYILYHVKIYILLTFLPASIVWIFLENLKRVRIMMVRILLFPLVLTTSIVFGYYAMLKAGEDNPKYAVDALSKTAHVTAYDIRYWTGKDAGSGYSLGELDGTWQSLIRLAPQAINVSLFRPYLWEISNPLMALSAVESLMMFILTLILIGRARSNLYHVITQPAVLFCVIFSLTFAFAVGVSTYNFGTLARYKIPLIPFFLTGMAILYGYVNKAKKEDELAATE